MSEEEALRYYQRYLRWFGWGAFATLASLPLFLYVTLYVWSYLNFGSLIVMVVFAIGLGRRERQWERAKFGGWLDATQLSILPVLAPMYSGGFLAWVGINVIFAMSPGYSLPF